MSIYSNFSCVISFIGFFEKFLVINELTKPSFLSKTPMDYAFAAIARNRLSESGIFSLPLTISLYRCPPAEKLPSCNATKSKFQCRQIDIKNLQNS